MKIFKSIKWRLQLWYGLAFTIMIIGLTGTNYQLEHERLFNNIYSELRVALENMTGVMQMPLPRGGPDGPPGLEPPGRQFPDRHDREQSSEVNQAVDTLLHNAAASGWYYVIWSPEGDELKRSTNAPSDVIEPTQPGMRVRGEYYEIMDNRIPPSPAFPPGSVLLAGRSFAPELNELHRRLMHEILTGALSVLPIFYVGWLITFLAMRPVENISAAAVKISAGDLSQRINAAETESELGQLAAILNSTFARLEAAFAQQKQFASDAAHELRTPVSVILTQTQTALSRERESKDYKQTIEACQRAAQRMRKLISALLELARLDAGQEQMKRLRFDLSKTVADAIELIHPLADERGVRLTAELSPLEIDGDAERLGQVVTNLLTNAIEYNHDGGQVKATLKAENSMAVLTVSDTGQGIPAEDMSRVFERFYRADKSRSSGNAGLGLAICQAIVTAHGGSIEVASEENSGTTFTVRLPA